MSVAKAAKEAINQCKDSCYGKNGREAGNIQEGDYGTWENWEDVLVQSSIKASLETLDIVEMSLPDPGEVGGFYEYAVVVVKEIEKIRRQLKRKLVKE